MQDTRSFPLLQAATNHSSSRPHGERELLPFFPLALTYTAMSSQKWHSEIWLYTVSSPVNLPASFRPGKEWRAS